MNSIPSIEFPPICAWCCSKEPTTMHLVKAREETDARFYIVAYSTRVYTYRFSLPVYAGCKSKLNRNRVVGIILTIAGGPVMALGMAALLLSLDLADTVCVAAFMTCFLGAILGKVASTLLARRHTWGKVTNGYPVFRNDAFQRAFDALNIDTSRNDSSVREGSTSVSLPF